MDSDPRVDARAPITRRRDAVARALVWSAWLATTLAAVVCLLAYARNVPITEDWTLVPALTGNQPDLPSWLWSQNNEHRVPLPRAVLLALLALSHDFRAGMVFNVAVLAALAAAMIRTSATLRGRTSLTDVFFPIVFLHLGNWENLFWSWQLSFVLPVTLACGFLLLLLRRPALATPGAALLAAACVASLPLCGAIGLAFVPALAGWTGISGSLAWRDAGAGSRRAAGILIGGAALAMLLSGLYLVGYERPSWTPPEAGVAATLRTTAQFLALGFGPISRLAWTLPMTAAVALAAATAILLGLAISRRDDVERWRALGLLAFFASTLLLALAVGGGRAAVIEIYGGWPLRYVLLAALPLVAAFFAWELYAPPRLRSAIPAGLCLALLVLIPWNTVHGFWWRDWYTQGVEAFERDVGAAAGLGLLAERNGEFLFHSMDPTSLASHMRMLRDAEIGLFSAIPEDGREVAIAALSLLDATGQPTAVIGAGDGLEIVIAYRTAEPVESAIFGVSLSRDQTIYYESNMASTAMDLPSLRGDGRVSLHLERLDLAPGSYFVDVGIYEHSWAFAYDYRWHMGSLEVRASGCEKGVLCPPQRWEADVPPAAESPVEPELPK